MGLSSSKPESPFTMGVHVVPGSPVGETHALRALTATESLFSEYDGARTLYENFQRGVKLSRDLPCMGYRDQSKPGMPFVWQTYGEVATRVTHVGSALVSRGLRQGAFVGIYSANCLEWVLTEQACNQYSLVSVPLYDTLGPDAVKYIVNETEMVGGWVSGGGRRTR